MDIIDRLNGENYVDAIDDAITEIGELRARQAGLEREAEILQEQLTQSYKARENFIMQLTEVLGRKGDR